MTGEAVDTTNIIAHLVTALGGPAAVGGLLMLLLKKNLLRIDGEQTTRFEDMGKKFEAIANEIKESDRKQEAALSDIRTRLAVYEAQSAAIARAVEEFRAMDKTVTLLQAKVDASFRVIDDMKSRFDRFDARIDHSDGEIARVRDLVRSR